MTYADFPCYQDFFKGILIKDGGVFRTFAERASEFIDTVTFDRINEEIFELHKNKIQKCMCALTEQFFKRNIAICGDFLNQDNMPKTSESIGAYSVSFANPYDYFQELSMSDSDFQKSLKSTVLRYLGSTGLLYRGVE